MHIYKQYLDPHTPPSEVYGLLIKTDKPNRYAHPHTHNYCEFTLFIKGDTIHIANETAQPMSAGTLCFIRATDVHYNKKITTTPTEYYNIGIPNDILENTLKFFNISTDFLYKPKEPIAISLNRAQYTSILHKCEEFMNTDFGFEHGCLFQTLLAEIIYIIISSNNEQIDKTSIMPKWFADLLLKIEQKQDFTLTASNLKNMCNYSYNHIIRYFNKYLSCTPTEYLNQLKLENAAKMLLKDDCTILDVCFSSGFNNETYFYKQFKKYYLMTPKEYLKKHKNL